MQNQRWQAAELVSAQSEKSGLTDRGKSFSQRLIVFHQKLRLSNSAKASAANKAKARNAIKRSPA